MGKPVYLGANSIDHAIVIVGQVAFQQKTIFP